MPLPVHREAYRVPPAGGVLYAVLKVSDSPKSTGVVTGGTGTFKHATGTVAGTDLNKAGTKIAVTITYRT